MVGCGALARRCDQRASCGTQKMLAARYSSGSSGSAPSARAASSSACLASKASEMYLRKIRPRTTCLYSAASMLLRRASAAAQSVASNPRLPVVALRAWLLDLAKLAPS
jgi:3-oxoacyl-ACP reductase-like protein